MSTAAKHDDNREILAFTQNLRRRVVNKLIGNHPSEVNDDPKVIGALNQTLDSMDRQALVLMRLAQDKKNNDDNRAAAVLIAQINQQTGKGENPFRRGDGAVTVTTPDPEAELADLPAIELQAGHDFIGVEEDCYDDFVKRLEAE